MLKETLAALRGLITTNTSSYLQRLPPLNDPQLVPARKGEVATRGFCRGRRVRRAMGATDPTEAP
jgi:hypothetical protein